MRDVNAKTRANAEKCARHIVSINGKHPDFRELYYGGELNLARAYLALIEEHKALQSTTAAQPETSGGGA